MVKVHFSDLFISNSLMTYKLWKMISLKRSSCWVHIWCRLQSWRKEKWVAKFISQAKIPHGILFNIICKNLGIILSKMSRTVSIKTLKHSIMAKILSLLAIRSLHHLHCSWDQEIWSFLTSLNKDQDF